MVLVDLALFDCRQESLGELKVFGGDRPIVDPDPGIDRLSVHKESVQSILSFLPTITEQDSY
jgi:hypothetical protein